MTNQGYFHSHGYDILLNSAKDRIKHAAHVLSIYKSQYILSRRFFFVKTFLRRRNFPAFGRM